MGRLEKYRETRLTKKKYFFSILLFILILVSGLFVTDYITNKLMSNEGSLKIVSVKNLESCLEINLMNNKFYINTSYINRDLRRIKDFFAQK